MLKNVRLHREITEAWAEHGGDAPSEAPLSERERVEGRSESKRKAREEGDR